ncbi:MAG TPA: PIN domain-containing protein [Chloroflexota bacterium]|nr:PIN domain-containing protein [Chloroflexota bacterium]
MALVVLDASVVIGFLDATDARHDRAVAALSARRTDELIVPASVYAETLVRPFREGTAAVAKAERFYADFVIRIEPLSRDIARRAAELRSRRRGLKLPDAIVIATGEVLSASAILTADEEWPRISRRARKI